MSEPGVKLTEDFARRIARVVRWAEDRMMHEATAGRPTPPAPPFEGLYARVTSATADGDGNHPATITAFESGAWEDYGEVLLQPLNGEALEDGRRYPCQPAGVEGDDLVYVATPPGLTVEDDDASPSYAGVHTLRFDQGDGFSLSSPSGGVVVVDFSGGGGGSITVQDDDANPSYGSITTLRFDQDDGFVLSNPGGGSTAQVDLQDAGLSQVGKVNAGAQNFDGTKFFDDVAYFCAASSPHVVLQEGNTGTPPGSSTNHARISPVTAGANSELQLEVRKGVIVGTSPLTRLSLVNENSAPYFLFEATAGGSSVRPDLKIDNAGSTVTGKSVTINYVDHGAANRTMTFVSGLLTASTP